MKAWLATVVAALAVAILLCEGAARTAFDGVFVDGPLAEYASTGYKRALAGRLGGPEVYEYARIQNVWLPEKTRDEISGGGVLFLGDSVLYGSGVAAEAVFTRRLKILRPDLKAVNLGVPGANIFQVHSLFQRFYPQARPSLVVYVLSENDMFPALTMRRPGGKGTEILFPEYLFGTPDGALRLLPGLPIPLRELLARSAIFRLGLIASAPSGFQPSRDVQERFAGLLPKFVSDMAARCRQDGVPFLIFFPENEAAQDYSPKKRMLEALRAALPASRRQAMASSLFLPDGFHLNEAGHERAALFLAEFLRSAGGKARGPRSQDR